MSTPKMEQAGNPEQQPQNARIVQVVGNYLVGPTVGKGFFAKVKRVEDPYRKVFAMKCFDKERISKSAHSLRQVEKEINALRLCHHPNIARFHEVLEVENSVYLVMEFVPHGELFDYIKHKGRLSEPEAAHMARQLLLALSYCHHMGVAHRDVKPENILIDESGNIKLVDFGLCSFYSSADSVGGDNMDAHLDPDAEPSRNARDDPGSLLHTQCGSPHYAAPEVLLGVGYHGPSADIWSFGVLLYAMVTGSLPFTARVIPQLVQKIVAGVYRMPAYLSPLLKHLISGILRVNPKDRLSIDDLLNHPWFSKTETWVPEVQPSSERAASPTASRSASGKHVDASVANALAMAARRHPSTSTSASSSPSTMERKTCGECGGQLTAQVDARGQIVLGDDNRCRCAHQIFSTPAGDAVQPNMQMPRLFHAPDADTDVEINALSDDPHAYDDGIVLSPLPVSECWRPPQIDLDKAVASDREFELMGACDKGNLSEVKRILYDSEPCPGVMEILSGKKDKSSSREKKSGNGESRSLADSLAGFAICGSGLSGSPSTVHPEEAATASSPLLGRDEDDDDNVTVVTDYRLRSCVCPAQTHRLDIRVGGLDKWTALHVAARAGHQDVCEELLLSCLPLDVNAVTKNRWTPLMFAADRGHEGVVEVLLKFRADIHTVSTDGKTAIYLARERSHATISKRLTEASSVRHLHTLHHHSVVAANALQTLSAAAAHMHRRQAQTDGEAVPTPKSASAAKTPTPLRIARASRNSWFALSGLQTELSQACEQGDIEKIDKLFPLSTQSLEGTDYDLRNVAKAQEVEDGETTVTVPLSLSVPPASGAQVDFLALGIDNWTLLHFAARRGQTSTMGHILELLLSCLRASTVVEFLNATTKTGWTALMMAVDKAHVATVKLLVECGADVNKRSVAGETALSMAMMYRDDERYKEIIAVIEEAIKRSKEQ